MRRIAAFLLLAGIVPIQLLASDYFTTRRTLFESESPSKATTKVDAPKQTTTTKKEVAGTEYLVKVPDAKATGTNAPRSTTSYMKGLFTTDSTSAVWLDQPPGSNVTQAQMPGVSVYAVPPKATAEAPKVVTAKATKKPATVAAPTLTAGPLPTRPTIPAPTPSAMALPPGTVIQPVESVAAAPAQPVARNLSPMRQPTPTQTATVQAAGTSMPLPTGFKLVGNESKGPYAGLTLAQAHTPAPVPAQPAPAPMPVYDQGPYTGYNGSGCCPTCGAGPRDSSGMFSGRLLSWMCFKPTTRDALPRFQPLPYVTPIIAFRCDGYGCGAGSYGGGCGPAGCATGNCSTGNCGSSVAGRFGIGDRGCKTGCVPPSDGVFPGYQFATGSGPIMGQPQPQSHTSYKPAAQPAPLPVQAQSGYYKPMYVNDASVRPAGGDVLARPFTRP